MAPISPTPGLRPPSAGLVTSVAVAISEPSFGPRIPGAGNMPASWQHRNDHLGAWKVPKLHLFRNAGQGRRVTGDVVSLSRHIRVIWRDRGSYLRLLTR